MSKGSASVLLNVYSPPPVMMEAGETSIWFRPEGASVSIGFGGDSDYQRLMRLKGWLEESANVVRAEIRRIEKVDQ